MPQIAFVDQLSGETFITNYDKWKEKVFSATGKQFGDTYGDVTKEILYSFNNELKNSRTSTFEYRGWKLTLIKTTDKLTGELLFKLKITGNPSAIHHGGKNYRNILFDDFKSILLNFSETFHLDLQQIRITAPFEPSCTIVNIPAFAFSQKTIQNRLIAFQGDKKFYEKSNKAGLFMGYEAKSAHYTKKVYLPAIKFNEPLNFLRVETSYKRVSTFKRKTSLSTWDDLLTEQGQYACSQVVLEGWDDTIVYDPKLRRSIEHPDYLNEMIKKGGNVDFWINEFPHLAKCSKTRQKRIQEYRDLSLKKGHGLHAKVRNWIKNEAEKFQNVTAWLTRNNIGLYNTLTNTNITTIEEDIKKSKEVEYKCINRDIIVKNIEDNVIEGIEGYKGVYIPVIPCIKGNIEVKELDNTIGINQVIKTMNLEEKRPTELQGKIVPVNEHTDNSGNTITTIRKVMRRAKGIKCKRIALHEGMELKLTG